MKKYKILFVTYYWPPCGGVSVQRILHFVNYLSKAGYDCHIIIPQNPTYYQEDPELAQKVNAAITLHKVRIVDMTSLIKRTPSISNPDNVKQSSGGILKSVSKYIRSRWFIPDPKILWKRQVVKKALELQKRHNFDLLFTNGTPHSVHLAGLEIKEKTAIPWIADFRDPWTKIDYFDALITNAKARAEHLRLEQLVLQQADLVLTVSPSWANDFSKLGANKTQVITNGFDDHISRQDVKELRFTHVGSLHTDRSIITLIQALNDLETEKKKVLELAGSVSSSTLKEIQGALKGIELSYHGVVSHQSAKAIIGKASILLLPINSDPHAYGRIPAKLFEYLSAGIPILQIGQPTGDAAKILNACNAGTAVEHDAKASDIQQVIQQLLQAENTISIEQVKKYSREQKGKELITVIQGLIK